MASVIAASPERGSASFPPLTVGERFNPWRKACGFYAPSIVWMIPRLGDGPKLLYTYLVSRAGRNGRSFPSQKRIATDLGKSERQIRYDLKKLQEARLIEVVHNRGKESLNRDHDSNDYHFLFHQIFLVASTKTAAKANKSRPKTASTSGNGLPPPGGKGLPTNNTHVKDAQLKTVVSPRLLQSPSSQPDEWEHIVDRGKDCKRCGRDDWYYNKTTGQHRCVFCFRGRQRWAPKDHL